MAESNRLTSEEREALRCVRQWFNHQTPENLNHLRKAAKSYGRAENAPYLIDDRASLRRAAE